MSFQIVGGHEKNISIILDTFGFMGIENYDEIMVCIQLLFSSSMNLGL